MPNEKRKKTKKTTKVSKKKNLPRIE